mmetsp:Transcript_28317/g.57489  ORF Transcript_28317/g.57489 Transcript_28317/m.57489 type:complete len:204 (-) Transcript_28317:618-1229(-)
MQDKCSHRDDGEKRQPCPARQPAAVTALVILWRLAVGDEVLLWFAARGWRVLGPSISNETVGLGRDDAALVEALLRLPLRAQQSRQLVLLHGVARSPQPRLIARAAPSRLLRLLLLLMTRVVRAALVAEEVDRVGTVAALHSLGRYAPGGVAPPRHPRAALGREVLTKQLRVLRHSHVCLLLVLRADFEAVVSGALPLPNRDI